MVAEPSIRFESATSGMTGYDGATFTIVNNPDTAETAAVSCEDCEGQCKRPLGRRENYFGILAGLQYFCKQCAFDEGIYHRASGNGYQKLEFHIPLK